MSLRRNGVLVHDDIEITGPNDGGAETAVGGPLQDHGDPVAEVRYRSIWLEPLA
ncbi:hypothetical protein [Micromonospora marina]|uniref:hypothetical protein n=1 Tax=Micromonospora marina TaxID=307120 RepID=UPI003D761200